MPSFSANEIRTFFYKLFGIEQENYEIYKLLLQVYYQDVCLGDHFANNFIALISFLSYLSTLFPTFLFFLYLSRSYLYFIIAMVYLLKQVDAFIVERKTSRKVQKNTAKKGGNHLESQLANKLTFYVIKQSSQLMSLEFSFSSLWQTFLNLCLLQVRSQVAEALKQT